MRRHPDARPRPARQGATLALVGLALMVCMASVVAVAIGSAGLAIPGVMDDASLQFLTDLRLPRVVGGLLVGAALSVAGLLAQSVTRNPLCDPGLMGVSAGALFAGVLARMWFTLPETSLVWPCIMGAVAATSIVLLLNHRRTAHSPVHLVVVGLALNAALGGATAIVAGSAQDKFLPLRLWLAGSLAGRTWEATEVAALLTIPVLAATLLARQQIDSLAVGMEQARSWGASPGITSAVLVLVIAWLVGSATALAGPVSFVGLAAPHIGRRLFRWSSHTVGIPVSAGVGAALVVGADLAGRMASSPGEVPVSIVCSLVGAPVLIALAVHSGRAFRGRGEM